MSRFDRLLSQIRPQEPVSASVANRAPAQLDANVRFLKDLIDAIGEGTAIILRDRTVDAAMKVGCAVYLDAASEIFKGALAKTETTAGGSATTTASSHWWGVILAKTASDKADILLSGYAALDLSQAIEGTLQAGVYYLSGTTAGKLTPQRPPVSVPVLRADGQGGVLVVPQLVDFADRHVHHRFELDCLPAGTHTPPAEGERHTITDADDSLPGWLPADHPSFDGKAPSGARFGYNLLQHDSLRQLWPPLPLGQAVLEINQGGAGTLNAGVPLGADGLCILDRYGLWWLSDCYGQVPWPTSYDSTSGASESASSSECPTEIAMKLILWFSRLQFATDAAVVRSLVSVDSRLKIRCVDGSAASTGELEAYLAIEYADGRTDDYGGIAFKSLHEGKFRSGPVVAGLYTSSDNVSLSGIDTFLLDPEDENSPTVHYGPVEISVSQLPTRELPIELVRLMGVASEEFFQDYMYLSFPESEETAYRAKISVPADAGFSTGTLKLRFRVWGRAAGTLPDLTLTARRLPRPANGLTTPLALPLVAAEFSVSLDCTSTLASANQYVEAESAAFAVAAGDVVFFTLQREASDGYNAAVGILDQKAILEAE